MSTDEWSIDAEGKYTSNTTLYSPVHTCLTLHEMNDTLLRHPNGVSFHRFLIELMKVLITEFNPCTVTFITELSTFIHDICKYVFQICTTNRMI